MLEVLLLVYALGALSAANRIADEVSSVRAFKTLALVFAVVLLWPLIPLIFLGSGVVSYVSYKNQAYKN